MRHRRAGSTVHLLHSVFFTWCMLTMHCLGETDERPNVLMILVDDLKPILGCYGDPFAKTPNIDRLASRGMRFERAYCNQAVCAPSRFTLMLGSHSTSTGLYGLGSKLRERLPDAVTLPQYFASHGYHVEGLGKVFHVGHGNEGDPESFPHGFVKDKVIEYLDAASTGGGQLTREEALFTNQSLDRIPSLPRGAAWESPVVPDDAYADGRMAKRMVQKLQEADDRRKKMGTPFFLMAGFVRPHLPFSAPRKYWDLYDPHSLPLAVDHTEPKDAPTVAGKRGGEIAAYEPIPPGPVAPFPETLQRHLVHGYYASTSYMDAQLGLVMEEFDRLELGKNTIVVFWSDHGFHLGDHGIWTKHTNYEQANRIPMVICGPSIAPGSTTGQLAQSVDLYPTLAELAGLPHPTGPQAMDGLSLVPVLQDPAARIRDHAYHVFPKEKLGRAIRTERYRLVEWRGNRGGAIELELYDYQDDPAESRNLATEQPEVARELQRILEQYPPAVRAGEPARRQGSAVR